MTSSVDFWTERAKKSGHTGWNDPIIYLFDQSARLIAIEHVLLSLKGEKGKALDFGCGTGDFSVLLSKYYQNVVGFDICDHLIQKNQHKYSDCKNMVFLTSENVEHLDLPEKSFNLILSITVLDHILSDNELEKHLALFEKILASDGYIVILEYAPLKPMENNSSYQKFRSLIQWTIFFENAGFEIEKIIQFYHPNLQPCKSYIKYRKNINILFAFLINIFKKNKLFAVCVTNHIRKKYQNDNDFYWDEIERESPLKIITLKKVQSDNRKKFI